jgi:hypothetical protein
MLQYVVMTGLEASVDVISFFLIMYFSCLTYGYD